MAIMLTPVILQTGYHMLTSRILRPGLDLEARTLQRPRRSRLKAEPNSPAARDTRISKGIWNSQSLLYMTDLLLSKDSMPVYPLQPQHSQVRLLLSLLFFRVVAPKPNVTTRVGQCQHMTSLMSTYDSLMST